jgi:hypothetical protein
MAFGILRVLLCGQGGPEVCLGGIGCYAGACGVESAEFFLGGRVALLSGFAAEGEGLGGIPLYPLAFFGEQREVASA